MENVTKSLIFPITKVDSDKRQAAGWASVIEENGEVVVDAQGDMIPEAVIVEAAHRFMRDYRKGRVMHTGPHAIDIVESVVLTKAMQNAMGIDLGKVGWWIVAEINDPAIWKRVESGDLRAFSIGGHCKREAA